MVRVQYDHLRFSLHGQKMVLIIHFIFDILLKIIVVFRNEPNQFQFENDVIFYHRQCDYYRVTNPTQMNKPETH